MYNSYGNNSISWSDIDEARPAGLTVSHIIQCQFLPACQSSASKFLANLEDWRMVIGKNIPEIFFYQKTDWVDRCEVEAIDTEDNSLTNRYSIADDLPITCLLTYDYQTKWCLTILWSTHDEWWMIDDDQIMIIFRSANS